MMAASTSDETYRAGLPASVCSCCGLALRRLEDRVYVYATWRGVRQEICRDCWHTFMVATGDALMRLSHTQASLPGLDRQN